MAHHNNTPLHHILRLDPNFPDLSLYLGPLASGKVALDESLSDPVLRPENNGHYPQQNGYQIEPLSPDSDVPSSILSASPSFNPLSESGGELSILDALATFDDRTTQLTNNAANQIYGFKPDIQRQQTLPKLQPIPIPPLNIPGETLGHPFPTPSPSRSDVPPTSSSYFSLSRSSLGPALMALWSDNHSSAQSSLDTINPTRTKRFCSLRS
ncbi:hypothetical protein BKA69DRAFT_730381 [Paraphysoderma sedebokerense]|nr:hypothetical protein BKA69DRAFT_730381 [Paraphysoderma sedebokerense]